MVIKFKKCKRCNQMMLEKKNYRDGIVSYCNYCNGFFNEEGRFIEEGSVYWDIRYKRGYWTDMEMKTGIWALMITTFSAFFDEPLYLFGIVLVPIFYVLWYFKLKRENYFIPQKSTQAKSEKDLVS